MPIKSNFSEETFNAALMRGLVRGGSIVRTEMVRLILRTSKSGHAYTRRGVTHIASAPGEPFASDTGATVQSIGPPVANNAMQRVTITISGANARKLEFGTSRMEPRPFARPAVANTRAQVKAAVLAELRAVNFGFTGLKSKRK